MPKRALIVAVTALAISIPAIAGAAPSNKHTAKSHPITIKVVIANINPPGGLVQGSQTYAGTADGKIGGKTFVGAVRGTNVYTGANFTGTITTFGPQGSTVATVTGTGTASASGGLAFSGSTKVTGGTGIYKGAKGSLTFTGTEPAHDADGDTDSGVATFTASGTLKY
jgi:hypothetical protein